MRINVEDLDDDMIRYVNDMRKFRRDAAALRDVVSSVLDGKLKIDAVRLQIVTDDGVHSNLGLDARQFDGISCAMSDFLHSFYGYLGDILDVERYIAVRNDHDDPFPRPSETYLSPAFKLKEAAS